jgi:hypothetical protein
MLSVTSIALAGGRDHSAGALRLGCHGAFTFPSAFGFPGTSPSDDIYDAVMVLGRHNMSCSAALRVAAKARALTGLKMERGPQFGGGGWGGPFRTGRFHCFVLSRGSDFIDAKCNRGSRRVRFYDHRQNWSIPTPGWHKPARRT